MAISILKETAIGVGIGYFDSYITIDLIHPICQKAKGTLSNFYCLRPAAFFDLQRVALFTNSIAGLKDFIAKQIIKIIPETPQVNFNINCAHFTSALGNLIDRAQYLPRTLTDTLHAQSLILYRVCCKTPKSVSSSFAHAFAEELIFRLGIQKIALTAIPKLFPNGRIKNILSRPSTRILLSALAFAFCHTNISVAPQFVSGLALGYLYENSKHGLLSTTIAHTFANILITHYHDMQICNHKMELAITSWNYLIENNSL